MSESFEDALERASHKKRPRILGVWQNMKTRCYNPNFHAFQHYGGRGIMVCDEWKNDFNAFAKWAMENGYDPDAPYGQCTLDRIDVDGNYEPSNCRWVDFSVQRRNQRQFKNKFCRPVIQTDMDGNFICEHESVKDASRNTGIPASNITAVCKGNMYSIHGYIWRYKSPTAKELEQIEIMEARKKEYAERAFFINQIDIDGAIVRQFSSLHEASRETGCHRQLIKKVCDGLQATTKGMRFAYAR